MENISKVGTRSYNKNSVIEVVICPFLHVLILTENSYISQWLLNVTARIHLGLPSTVASICFDATTFCCCIPHVCAKQLCKTEIEIKIIGSTNLTPRVKFSFFLMIDRQWRGCLTIKVDALPKLIVSLTLRLTPTSQSLFRQITRQSLPQKRPKLLQSLYKSFTK